MQDTSNRRSRKTGSGPSQEQEKYRRHDRSKTLPSARKKGKNDSRGPDIEKSFSQGRQTQDLTKGKNDRSKILLRTREKDRNDRRKI